MHEIPERRPFVVGRRECAGAEAEIIGQTGNQLVTRQCGERPCGCRGKPALDNEAMNERQRLGDEPGSRQRSRRGEFALANRAEAGEFDENLPAGGDGPVFALLHGRHGWRPMLLRTVDGPAPGAGRKILERDLQRTDGIAEPCRQPMRDLIRVQEDVVESRHVTGEAVPAPCDGLACLRPRRAAMAGK